jgi:hypothetical protein
MRRILIGLSLLAVIAGIHACAADAPTRPPSGGGGQSTALQIQLFTSDANPRAGTCTLVEAVVSLNGISVPDGTGVSFTTDFGSFSQNGLPTVSVVTANGAAITALCGPGAGSAKVKATATVSGKTGSATITIVFQPDAGTLPFVSSCNPSLGSKQGGDIVTLNGGRFFGTTSTTRIQFTAGGITRDGIVTAVTANAVTVQTPAFPELTAPSTPAAVTLTLGTNLPSPVVLSLPTCFTFGTASSSTPTISALLPSSGTNEGNTRVTIIGSGFASTGVQVFFGAVEAAVVSVNFNQIVVLSPPAFGAGAGNLNATVDVTVKNINSGAVSNGVSYRFTPAIQLTSINNNIQFINNLTALTIFGQGFQAPVAVDLAGIAALVQSVSATEIIVTPGVPLVVSCADIAGNVTVTNIDSGDTAAGLAFTYLIPKLVITSIVPQTDHDSGGGLVTSVTISGSGFPTRIVDADVKFGSKTAFVTDASVAGQLVVTIPPGTVVASPACVPPNVPPAQQVVETVDVTVTNRATGCSATIAQGFRYTLACVVPTPTP